MTSPGCGRAVPPEQRHRLQGVRLAGPEPLPPAGQVVTVELGDTTLRVTGPGGELPATVPRTTAGETTRFKAHGTRRTP